MARMRITLVLLLALAAGGGLALGTYRYMQNVPARTVEVPTSHVVVAASDLQLGAELKATDLRTIQWPAGATPEGSVLLTMRQRTMSAIVLVCILRMMLARWMSRVLGLMPRSAAIFGLR